MSYPLQRSLLTTAVLAAANSGSPEVGDHDPPKSGVGWVSGTPNSGNFVGYSVLTALAGNAMDNGSFGNPQTDLQLNYALTSYGVSRTQCEDTADKVRQAVLTIKRQTISQWEGASSIRVMGVNVSYGTLQRNDAADPPLFVETDTYTIMVSVS